MADLDGKSRVGTALVLKALCFITAGVVIIAVLAIWSAAQMTEAGISGNVPGKLTASISCMLVLMLLVTIALLARKLRRDTYTAPVTTTTVTIPSGVAAAARSYTSENSIDGEL